MPEFPEMQALAERLDERLVGEVLERIDVLQFSALKTVSPSPDDVVGSTIASVGRRAKYLIFELDPPGNRIMIHLSQGGRVDLEEPPKTTRPRGATIRLRFGGISMLLKEFGTERKAAMWILPEGNDGPLEGLGPEAMSKEFAELVRDSTDRRRIHTLLRDQRTVAGIGRGFSDEILHRARLSPYDTLASLDEEARSRLIEATREVLEEALAKERKRKGGLPTKLEGRFAIHGKHGEPCPRCGEVLKRVSYESYEIVYCPTCQTAGKILADRRMSRLIR